MHNVTISCGGQAGHGAEMTVKEAISGAITGWLTSHRRRDLRRTLAALPRRLGGRMSQIHYFHQADDPYSHLCLQALDALAARAVPGLSVHIVPPPDDAAAPERARLAAWSIRDAGTLARRLGLSWSENVSQPAPEATALASAALVAAARQPGFAAAALKIGEALWRGDVAALAAMPSADAAETDAALTAAAKMRTDMGHYLGGTFLFEGEWYWGLDRLHYLEARLKAAGLIRPGAPDGLIAPVKDVECKATPSNGAKPVLDYFFSFRSPYTWISIPRVRRLARHYGADLRLRFILPMVMRGLPVPPPKSRYIMFDTKREADRVGLLFGKIVDPRGAATERGIAVLAKAIPLGRGEDFAESFLRTVWSEGVDGATDAGLLKIAARAGLDEAFVRAALADESWRPVAEANRAELFAHGLWGAPTLSVDGRPAHWGQDRLWVVENELIDATGAR